jgi:rubrerythrin
MKYEDFTAIIDFAIDREREAAEFYLELQKKARFTGQKEMLKELEMMERGHITVLRNILTNGEEKAAGKNIKDIKDLNISEYLVKANDQKELTYQDILIEAMKREEASKNLYTDLAQRFQGTDMKGIFRLLAAEETGHKMQFEKLYNDDILINN